MSFVKAPLCFLWCVHITSLFCEDIVIPLIYYLTINIAINHREKIIVCFWSFISAINHHFPGKGIKSEISIALRLKEEYFEEKRKGKL